MQAPRPDPFAPLGESAAILTDSALKKDRSAAHCHGLIRKLALTADAEIERNLQTGPQVACAIGCSHCCKRTVPVTYVELAAIAHEVSTAWKPAEVKALKGRIETYRSALAAGGRATCPLLVENRCSAYALRPLSCRATNSLDVNACVRWYENEDESEQVPMRPEPMAIGYWMATGIASASHRNRLSPDAVDMADSLGRVLDDPSILDQFFAGEQPLYAGDRPKRRLQETTEPSGFVGPDPSIEAFLEVQRTDGGLEASFAALKGSSVPEAAYLKALLPPAFSSQDEIEASLAKYDKAMDEFFGSDFDAGRAFDVLGVMPTFKLAYSGTDVKARLSAWGDRVHHQIAAKCLPDLVAPIADERKPGKLRVGYIGCSLRNHNGGRWALRFLQAHPADVETFVFDLWHEADEITEAFANAADHHYHLLSEVPEAARFIKEKDLDVLIFTDVGMFGRSQQFAALRLARKQAMTWGHPVTTGLPTMDVYFSSQLMEPENAQAHYREELVLLPNAGVVYPWPMGNGRKRNRKDLGLPGGHLAIMAQNLMKCLPQHDFMLREIAERTGNPIVMLRALARGEQRITEERLKAAKVPVLWVPRQGYTDFVDLLASCDVSLDPVAWNGANTTVDALHAGTPVVTLPGQFFRSRHTLAFATVAQAPKLIVDSPEAYVNLACDANALQTAMVDVDASRIWTDQSPAQALNAWLEKLPS